MEPKKYYRQLDVFLELSEEALDQARPHVREHVLNGLTQNGGVVPNAFVDNSEQAADHAAQDNQISASAMLNLALLIGLKQIAPSAVVADFYARPLPDDYVAPKPG